MARPSTKENLLTQASSEYLKLEALISSLSLEQQLGIFPFEGRDRQIRDCLVHLHEWHTLFITWVNSNISGVSIPFLPEPYNWRNYPEMNIKFWEAHQSTPLDEARKLFTDSHLQCVALVSDFSNDELFTKKYFDWTGSTSLGSYAVSATSAHYNWAFKIIKKYAKSLSS